MRRESFSLLRPTAFQGRADAPAVARTPPERAVPPRALGIDRVDDWLGGGLRGDGLHELFAAEPHDLPAALSFALILGLESRGGAEPQREKEDGEAVINSIMLLKDRQGGLRSSLRASAPPRESPKRTLLWLRCVGPAIPYAPGLVALGLDPAAVTLLTVPDGKALLRAALDSVRAGAPATVLLELSGRQPLLDLTATRRLVLAAAQSGTLVLILRSEAEPGLSAAHSRWRIASAPSRPLAANAPGHPVFALDLLRQRGGREGLSVLLEWNHATAAFREAGTPADPASLPRRASALAAGGARANTPGRAA